MWKSWFVHLLRLLVFVGILACIHLEARERYSLPVADVDVLLIRETLEPFANASQIGAANLETGLWPIDDQQGKRLGYFATTSPTADHVIGFSGPTNVALAFDTELKLIGAAVLSSRDTREHLAEVVKAKSFWEQFRGKPWSELAALQDIDAVSGATLTSLAIGESIVHRLGGEVPSLRFPEPLTLDEIRPLFTDAEHFKTSPEYARSWEIYAENGQQLGLVLSTSPAADHIVGYQGPTETLVALGPDGHVLRTRVRKSYDNQPYVSYLDEDWSWPELFESLTLPELATYDLEAHGVEGVSGATFTSMAVARGIIRTAAQATQPKAPATKNSARDWQLTPADYGAFTVMVMGILIAMTHLRGIGWLRVTYQVVLVAYLGFVNGDMLSQAMLVGWTQNGIPWKSALRLVVLASVAFVFPVVSKKNVYCSHLCAHGAVQQLLRNRLRFQLHPARNVRRFLSLIPVGLLVWVLLVAMLNLSFSLVDIEPFDAYLFQISGWAALGIALVGVFASLFVPMAYCRFGCPTGALLEYFRRTRRSDRLSSADGVAVVCLILAAMLLWQSR